MRKELKLGTIDDYIKDVCWKGRQRNWSIADQESCFKRVEQRIIGNEVEKKIKLREQYSAVDERE